MFKNSVAFSFYNASTCGETDALRYAERFTTGLAFVSQIELSFKS